MDPVCNRKSFQNPDKLPLNKLYLEHKTVKRVSKDEISLDAMLQAAETVGDVERWNKRYEVLVTKKPALDKCWLQQGKRYVKFHPFYPQFDDTENEEFLETNREFLETLKLLVNCPYYQFWCYIVFEPRVSLVVTHFLEHSPSPYAVQYLNGEFLNLYKEIYSCVCIIFERLLQSRLSESEYMSDDVTLEYLRKSEILNVRTIVMFCFLYNHTKPELVRRLIKFYFADNRRHIYIDELLHLMDDIEEEFRKLECLEMLPSTNSGGSILRRMPYKFDPVWLEETSSYLLEMAGSLNEFFSACAVATEFLYEQDFPRRIPHIYQKVYRQLYDMFEKSEEIGYDWSKYKTLTKQWLAIGQVEFLDLFYQFDCFMIEKSLNKGLSSDTRHEYLETYLHIISGALDDDMFIRDYNRVHPVAAQFQIVIDNDENFDRTQSDYLLTSLQSVIKEAEKDSEEAAEEVSSAREKCIEKHSQRIEASKSDSSKHASRCEVYESVYDTLSQYCDAQHETASTPAISESEPVIDALKQYAQLMKEWQNNPNSWTTDLDDTSCQEIESAPSTSTEIVDRPLDDAIEKQIQAVLEMLPDLKPAFVLRCLKAMDYKPEQVISSVLDNDLPLELLEIPQDPAPGPSYAKREKPKPKIMEYVGKKPGYRNANELLDDKKEKQDIKNLVLKASYTYVDDDDYDDRNDVYANFEREDEPKIYKRMKQSMPEYNVISDPSSSSSENEEEAAKPKNAFCEDPAVIRARREAQRGRVFRPPRRDVVGQPKGQGQDKTVLQSRDKKNVQKSSRANHNRKGGAQWKRNKGMIPS